MPPYPSGVNSDRQVALLCGVIALALGGVAVMFSVAVQGWELSALVRMERREPMAVLAEEADPNFAFVPDGGHYDGVYTYAIAMDPLAQGEANSRIDHPAYRYGRVGHGWLAWALSFGGRPLFIPAALAVLGIAGMGVAGYGASLLAGKFGWPAASGIVVALNPGLILGLTVGTSEALSAAVLVFALLAWLEGRQAIAAIMMAFLCLIKEPFIAVPAGLLVWELISTRGSWLSRPTLKRLLVLAATPIPLVAWWVYVFGVFGKWSFDQPWLISAPVLGWLDGAYQSSIIAAHGTGPGMQLGLASLPLLLTVGSAFLLGLLRAVHIRTPLDPIFVWMMVVFSLMSWWQLLFPKDMLRILAIPLLLLPAIIATPGRAFRPSA